ncbi:GNAT family N-acetyltransferase [Labrys sp. LIt4]|uniref:GNAT family N-acetyltransferase n=1 Tax=Labrys sp. LIt4 TaxID=2821355 RepID=UPI001AE0DBFB|nr:GNAT family N-acetyltransferase [Labrys sp. LIt4]MBP0579492.1 GNAT family N-acetyltransferase [Labrys sp. LIt4]
MELTTRPLTAGLWPAFETLFGEKGAKSGCWCMYWRIGSLYRRQAGAQNRDAFRAVVEAGPPPGLLAFVAADPVGWCQIGPRRSIPHIDRLWRLRSPDRKPVWSISCLYVAKDVRRQGVASHLVKEAIDFGRSGGATIIEAYPIDRRMSPSSSSTGFMTTFERLGFRPVPSPTPERPILRLELGHATG